MPVAISFVRSLGDDTTTLTAPPATLAGDNRAVLVFTSTVNGTDSHVSAVRYNDSGGALIDTLSANYVVDLFGFAFAQLDVRGGAGSPLGATSIYAAFTGAQYSNVIAAIHMTGVDQVTPFGSVLTNPGYLVSGVPQVVSRSFTGLQPGQKVVGSVGVLVVGVDIDFTITPTAGTTLEVEVDGALVSEPRWTGIGVLSTEADGSGNATLSATVTWNYSTPDQYAPFTIVGVPVNAAAGGGSETHDLDGDALGAATATGALLREARMAAGATGVGSASGALLKGVSLAGASIGVAAASAGLAKAVSLAGSATGLATANGGVLLQIQLAGQAAAAAAASGALSLGKPLAGAAQGQVTAGASLSLAVRMSAAAIAQAQAAGALSDSGLAGQAAGQATAGATLWLQVPLSGAALAQATGGGALTLAVQLSGAAVAQAAAAAGLRVDRTMAGAGQAVATMAGALQMPAELASSAGATAQAQADLRVVGPVQSEGLKVPGLRRTWRAQTDGRVFRVRSAPGVM